MEAEPENQERVRRLQPGTLWMAGAVVAGCALLGFSLLDDNWQEPTEQAPDPVAEHLAPELTATQTIALRVGQQWTAILDSRAGTGYSWQLEEILPAESPVRVAVSGVEHDESNCCGFPMPVTLTITAQKPGAAEVRLVYVRPWEKETAPARREVYMVNVVETVDE